MIEGQTIYQSVKLEDLRPLYSKLGNKQGMCTLLVRV